MKKVLEKVAEEVIKGVTGMGGNNSTKPKTNFKYTPFRYASDRLSIAKNTEKIYTDNGTIYWTTPREQDTPRWSHYLDKEKDQMIMNHYGKTVTRIGNEVTDSEQVQRLTKYPNLSPSSNTKDKSDKTIQPLKNVYANQTQGQHDSFKSDMEFALKRNGLNSVGMINDTKRKEVIDAYAQNKAENVKPFLNKGRGESQAKYEENASKRYEDRYKNNPKYLPKKKIPDYTSGPTIKYDEHNKLYTLDDDVTKLKTEFQTWKNWDFIPFILHDIANKKYLPFRSYINSVSDQSDAEWQQIRYIGRADNVQVYSGFSRIVSLDFTTVCFSLKELHPMWQRINYLVGLTKPSGYTSDDTLLASPKNANYIIPPFLKLNLGDMYVDQPVVMTSVALTIPPEAAWELTSDKENMAQDYEYLNGTVTTNADENIMVGQYPNMAQLSISFNFLEKRLPKTTNRHFGHYRSEDEPLNQEIEDEKGDPSKGFNYNLIHPDPANEVREEVEIEEGQDIPDEDDLNAPDPDPFQGFDNPACTTYPPSKYYRSSTNGNLKTKEDSRVKSELEDWKECACEQMVKMMDNQKRIRGQDAKNTCVWDGECISHVNGEKVPDGMDCVYTSAFEEEPKEEEDDIQPPKCPYPIGGAGETDDDGRPIGYTQAEKEQVDQKDPATLSRLKKRNLEYWVKDVSDFLAHKMGLGKIGNGPYIYQDQNFKENPPLSKIRRVLSKNASIVIEFNDKGNPETYAGQRVSKEFKPDFKIDCDEDDIQEIRELAGHYQPVIYVDVNQPFRIKLDYNNKNAITNDNYDNVNQVKTLLADFVSKRMNDSFSAPGNVGKRGVKKYGDLTRKEHKGTVIENDELYYIPYEEDRDKMIKGHKVYPGTSDYVNYEVNNDVSDQLKLGEGKKYAELKFGFYALVSKTKEKISGLAADKNIENEIADYIFEQFWSLNGETFGGGSTSEILGAGGTGTEMNTDQEKAVKLDRGGTRLRQQEIERLKQKLLKINNLTAQIRDPNIRVLGYEPIGNWDTLTKEKISNRMQDSRLQQIISNKWNNDASFIQIENYLAILEGTTVDDILEADKKFIEMANNQELVNADESIQEETDIELLENKIRQYERDQEVFNKVIEKDDSKPLPVGYYFDNKSSQLHFVPWVKDHVLEKIEFIDDGSSSNDDSEPSKSIVSEPKPTTDTPTPNKTPTWTWSPVKNANVYEVYFKGKTIVTKKTSYTPTDDKNEPMKLRAGLHTIEVKAGAPNKSGTGTDWSTKGIHEVKIDKRVVPPKPPKCPYKVGSEGEKDSHGRLVGYEVDDPFSSDIATQVNNGIKRAIERNIKMWAGDVMAYIIAKEDMGNLTYPADPNKVSWSTNDYEAVVVYEQNQMKFMYSGKTITTLGANGQDGHPTRLNGNYIGNEPAKYQGEFDMACGPNEDGSFKGAESVDDPDEPLRTPNPHSQTPTDNSKPMWRWSAIAGANKYKVTLRKVKASTSSGSYGLVTAEDYGIIQYSNKTEAKPLLALEDGLYEISVTAEESETKIVGARRKESVVIKSSEVGTHTLEIKDSTSIPATPTSQSNEGCEDYPKPYELFLSSSEWCVIKHNISGTRKLSVKNQWKKEVGLYLACKQGIDVSTARYNYTVFNDDGRIVKVILDGKEIIVENDEENTFFLNKGAALEGDERKEYILANYIPTWNPNDSYKSQYVLDSKLANCPGERSSISNKVLHNGVLYIAQTRITTEAITTPPGHRPDDVNDRTLPDNLMESHQSNLNSYKDDFDLKIKYYKRWWLTEEETALLESEEQDF
tara:strand:- start:7794 stop:13142 length:5349 start_codon:yes stop_codon:yes gene_type:complete